MSKWFRGPFTEPESEDEAYDRWRQEMDDKVSETPLVSGEYDEDVKWLRWQADMYMAGDDKFAYRLQYIATAIEKLQAERDNALQINEQVTETCNGEREMRMAAEARVRELELIAAPGRRTDGEYRRMGRADGWHWLPSVKMWARLDQDHWDAIQRAERAEARLAEYKEDAERYRWLRSHLDDEVDHNLMEHKKGCDYGFKQLANLDAAIDAARLKDEA